MVIVWGVGGLLAVLGAVLVMASLLRRGGTAENQRLAVIAGLVMATLGVVAISAAALAGDDDDGDSDDTVAAGDQSGTSMSAGKSSDDADDAGEADDTGAGEGSTDDGDTPDETALPECVDEHLAAEPVVADDDHYRLDVGVNRQVIVIMHSADAIALELVDGDEVLGVMRIGDQSLPVRDILNVFDVVDASCQPVSYTPQETDDPVADTHTTVIPLELGGRSYEVTFVQHDIQVELDVVLREAT